LNVLNFIYLFIYKPIFNENCPFFGSSEFQKFKNKMNQKSVKFHRKKK